MAIDRPRKSNTGKARNRNRNQNRTRLVRLNLVRLDRMSRRLNELLGTLRTLRAQATRLPGGKLIPLRGGWEVSNANRAKVNAFMRRGTRSPLLGSGLIPLRGGWDVSNANRAEVDAFMRRSR